MAGCSSEVEWCCKEVCAEVCCNLVGVFVLILKKMEVCRWFPLHRVAADWLCEVSGLATFHSRVAHSVDDCCWNAAQTEATDKTAQPTHVERDVSDDRAVVLLMRSLHCTALCWVCVCVCCVECADSVCPSFSPAACSASAALPYTLLVGTREAVVPGDGELTLAAAVVGAEKARRQEEEDGPVVSVRQRVEVGRADEWMEAMVDETDTEAEGRA